MNITSEFLDKHNVSGPRYTSYPPANFFNANFKTEDYIEQLKLSNKQLPENISIYVHIPFCPQRCHFCGCTTEIGQKRPVVERYIDAIKTEIRNVSALLDVKNRKVTQIHWGGGTPNAIAMRFIEDIMNLIKERFILDENAEVAIECSPAHLEYDHIDQLAAMGFNRMSLGIQDFRQDVLDVVNRQAPKLPVKDLVDYLKKKGFSGNNLDFIYGLPLQTVESLTETIKKAIDIRPDRIVTFSYAHVPWVKEEQLKLEKIGLPQPKDKMDMLINNIKLLQDAGYVAIGIDHFALPEDKMAQAFLHKRLHRNFQGYCTLETTGQVYAFGASSISQLWGAYAQNIKNTFLYMDAIEKTGFAIERGFTLDVKQQVVRSVINSIMCNGVLKFSEIAEEFKMTVADIKAIVNYDKSKLIDFEKDNIITINEDGVVISEIGHMIARNIAMAFDPDLKQGEAIYSKTV